MNWVWVILMGGIVGWLASIAMKTNAQMGLIANIGVGIFGSVLGFWLAPMIGIQASSRVGSFGIAFGGAVLLILILRRLGVFR